jgi:hypothetical protein
MQSLTYAVCEKLKLGTPLLCVDPVSPLIRGETYPFIKVYTNKGGNFINVQVGDKVVNGFYLNRFMIETKNLKKENQTMNSIKNYFKKHEDTIMTLGLVLLIDQFVFRGAFRNRIQKLIENLLGQAEQKLLVGEPPKSE